MAKATQVIIISTLIRDPALRAIFAKAERDNPPQPLPVEPRRREPVLSGGQAAVVQIENA